MPDEIYDRLSLLRAELLVKFRLDQPFCCFNAPIICVAENLPHIDLIGGLLQNAHHGDIFVRIFTHELAGFIGNKDVIVKLFNSPVDSADPHLQTDRVGLHPQIHIIAHLVLRIRFQIGFRMVRIVPLHHLAVQIEKSLRIGCIPLSFFPCKGFQYQIFVFLDGRRVKRRPHPIVRIDAFQLCFFVHNTPAIFRRRVPVLISAFDIFQRTKLSARLLHLFG